MSKTYSCFPQLNEITPYIDGNLFYGAGKAWEDALRLFKNGLLAATHDDKDNIKISFPIENGKDDLNLPFANPPSPRDHKLRPVGRFRRKLLFFVHSLYQLYNSIEKYYMEI